MQFGNPILSGKTLVRDAIQSEGYTPGVAGWSINRDGTAEFQNVIARGNIQADSLITPNVSITDSGIVLIGSVGITSLAMRLAITNSTSTVGIANTTYTASGISAAKVCPPSGRLIFYMGVNFNLSMSAATACTLFASLQVRETVSGTVVGAGPVDGQSVRMSNGNLQVTTLQQSPSRVDSRFSLTPGVSYTAEIFLRRTTATNVATSQIIGAYVGIHTDF